MGLRVGMPATTNERPPSRAGGRYEAGMIVVVHLEGRV